MPRRKGPLALGGGRNVIKGALGIRDTTVDRALSGRRGGSGGGGSAPRGGRRLGSTFTTRSQQTLARAESNRQERNILGLSGQRQVRRVPTSMRARRGDVLARQGSSSPTPTRREKVTAIASRRNVTRKRARSILRRRG